MGDGMLTKVSATVILVGADWMSTTSTPFAVHMFAEGTICASRSWAWQMQSVHGLSTTVERDFPGWPCDCGWRLAGLRNSEAQCMHTWTLVRLRLYQYYMYWAPALALLLLPLLIRRNRRAPTAAKASAVECARLQMNKRLALDAAWLVMLVVLLFLPR
eukprot:gnl/TRDRNA2_/TRDRNA2_168612_c3_seq1.p1 gnl/TRDRNA2_/TRDRNA2_168612_c3~~gnl/TRDRNA2_/TRDRNA2_168612_c3_seq1.p1  ORF type:complete len:159 (+),score=13.85 gnl/TRDRNA2_/TRDRNA2_168612_c3_seq1:149-625(+)